MKVPVVWLAVVALMGHAADTHAQGRQAGAGSTPPTARAAAPIDLSGQWVSVVTEDWRYRMVTPAKGDYQGIPMTPAAVKVAEAWDPGADTAAGLQCKSYGAGIIMRVPGRLRIAWQDDQTLRIETDAGTQTRVLRFVPGAAPRAVRSWQGDSVAQWQMPRASRGRGGVPPGPARSGSLKVVTNNLRAGYLRKNGVPYSENATVTEYFSLARLRSDYEVLVVTTVVEDPAFLTQPFIVSSQFTRQRDAAGWDPTPCSATW
jgi:hypothetical protein